MAPDALELPPRPASRRRTRSLSRRLRRALRRVLRRPPALRPAASLDLENAGELHTSDLWSAWALADLECALLLKAWRLAAPAQRQAAFHGYRTALRREAHVAELLARRRHAA